MDSAIATSIKNEVADIAARARQAARQLARVETPAKNAALNRMADAVVAAQADILAANAKDVAAAASGGLSKPLIERLTLNAERVKAMAEGLREIAALPDPTNDVVRTWTRPNGMTISQVRVPIGVIGMIYESRPNVTAEAAGLCLKSGNAVILRGGSDAMYSNQAILKALSSALTAAGLPADAVLFLPPQDRQSITALSQEHRNVDLIVARGSEEMIKKISAGATVPVLGHGKGICHVYVDKDADVEKAVRIALNAKVSRPSTCNTMETLLVHEYLLHDFLPRITQKYVETGVEIRGDERVAGLIARAKPATEEDWSTEYLDKIISIKAVDSLEEAIEHINRYGSGHTDSIVTEDAAAAAVFKKAVDSACVMVNASTRLHDGGVFGFGSEIGISTNKLHARGTMGLRELTTTKYLVDGTGQIRE